jgi:hypothetical protein
MTIIKWRLTLEEPILIFIPRMFSSKEPSSPRWLCLALTPLKSKTKESRDWGVAQCGVCERGGTPLFIEEWRQCFYLSLAQRHRMHYLSMKPCHRQSKGWLRGAGKGAAPLGNGPSLTKVPCHRLRVAGHELDVSCFPGVLSPFWVGLVGKSALETAFR